MNDPNDILKKIDDLKKGEMNMDLDIDDEFKELENELKNEKKKEKSKKKDKNESKTNKKAKKNEESDDDNLDDEDLDDELKELENEDLDDVSEDLNEEEEKKVEKKIEKKSEKKEEKKVEEKKEVIKKEEKKEEDKEVNEGEDIYQEKTENFYHSEKKMTALSVLQKEIEICDKIIKYKIDHKFDDEDIWENKKALVQVKYNNNNTFIQEGSLSIEDYYKEISKEFEFNKKLLEYVNKDKKLKSFEIPELKRRLNERIDLLNAEIKQIKEALGNQENDEEEKKEEEKKEEEKKEEEKKYRKKT